MNMENNYSYLTVDEFHNGYSTLIDSELTKIIRVCHYVRMKYQLNLAAEDIHQEVLGTRSRRDIRRLDGIRINKG
ncbi:MAG: hypothetical protein HRT37_17110 [Alteromonadaceae bacterium]|nr:hypothetical protein [Alteromonadaceae bacterium]